MRPLFSPGLKINNSSSRADVGATETSTSPHTHTPFTYPTLWCSMPMLTVTLHSLPPAPPGGGSALPGLGIVCCINVVISASQVEGNGECLCQFDFLTLRLSPLSLVICSDFNNPCQTPNSSPHSAPLLCRPCAPCATLPDRADRKLNIHLSCTKGGLSSWTNIVFLPLTASPVKLVFYYFFLSSSLSHSPSRTPFIIALPLPHCLRGGSVRAAVAERE